MCLRPEFKSHQKQLYHDPLPKLEVALKELMAEEAHLHKLGSLSSGHSGTSILVTTGPSVAASCQFYPSSDPSTGSIFRASPSNSKKDKC